MHSGQGTASKSEIAHAGSTGQAKRLFITFLQKVLKRTRHFGVTLIYEPLFCGSLLVSFAVVTVLTSGIGVNQLGFSYKSDNDQQLEAGAPSKKESVSFFEKRFSEAARAQTTDAGQLKSNSPYGMLHPRSWQPGARGGFGLGADALLATSRPLGLVSLLQQGESDTKTPAVESSSVGGENSVDGLALNHPQAAGVWDKEIRFGTVVPFSGPMKEVGRQMRMGVETAFAVVNDAGGIHGRQVKLFAADGGDDTRRTLDALRKLVEQDRVFGFIGNVGMGTDATIVPFVAENRKLLLGMFSGASPLRTSPPDHFIFNYRASSSEEADALIRYLLQVRALQPSELAVFTQQDTSGDEAFEAVTRALRSHGYSSRLLRLNSSSRNPADVTEAVAQLGKHRSQIRAVVMAAGHRPAANFIQKTRDTYPHLAYTSLSSIDSMVLKDELMLRGPRFARDTIVSQVVPALNEHVQAVEEFRTALAKYFPDGTADPVSFEGFVAGKILLEALRRVGPQPDTETLIDTLEAMRHFDLGLGTVLSFAPMDHQASHKVWVSQLDTSGRVTPLALAPVELTRPPSAIGRALKRRAIASNLQLHLQVGQHRSSTVQSPAHASAQQARNAP